MSENYETVAPVTPVTVQRPTFLTVLCILTFIGSGWGILSAFVWQDPSILAYASWYYWVIIALNLGTLIGALQMWKLKKAGLYIWTIAEIASVVLMWVIIRAVINMVTAGTLNLHTTNEVEQAMNTMGTAAIAAALNTGLIIGSLFPVAFIVMYWINAKHLR